MHSNAFSFVEDGVFVTRETQDSHLLSWCRIVCFVSRFVNAFNREDTHKSRRARSRDYRVILCDASALEEFQD